MHYRLDEPMEAMVKQLTLLMTKLKSEDYKHSLPPPFLEKYTKDILFLELYGRELLQELVQMKNYKESNKLFDFIISFRKAIVVPTY
ncbi:5557_t:CDS:2 [Acaulospora morrowiae]|uniref:5557_t:CDS:1 n=1 Tax=Acaulospora morrowiae TaxID=94023 RepID=A0A9N9AHB5_9GLOM|nr:5557_t:CDS:2 [Acaulospora morrowiae]